MRDSTTILGPLKNPRRLKKPQSDSQMDQANFRLENFALVKDEIESIFLEIEAKFSQLKKIIWAETDRKAEERCLHYDYD